MRGIQIATALALTMTIQAALCADHVREVVAYKGGAAWTVAIDSAYLHTHGSIFRTAVNIKYKSGQSLEKEFFALLDSFDLSLNPFNENSILYKVNHNVEVELDDWFITVFENARLVSEISEGLYDITAAPLINAWGFGVEAIDEIPLQSRIDSLLDFVDYRKVRIENRKLVKEDPRIQLNASSIAKGFAVDLVAELLLRHGISDFLVEIGGEVRVSGFNPGGNAWKLNLANPVDNKMSGQKQVEHRIVEIREGALASSGNTANYYIRDGKKYAHTINPLTGYPAESEILVATVVYPNCILADAFATAFMLMPLNIATRIGDSIPGLGYIFLYHNSQGEVCTARK